MKKVFVIVFVVFTMSFSCFSQDITKTILPESSPSDCMVACTYYYTTESGRKIKVTATYSREQSEYPSLPERNRVKTEKEKFDEFALAETLYGEIAVGRRL